MERHDGSEHGSAEAYMIQGTELNPYLIATPPLEQIETMDSEGNPKFIFDQGLYYPAAATNYYGYYCTGFESPGEWNDQQRFFGVDGPDLHYAGVQTENLPYVYYTPSYGYAQSPYNPYNPYIPGAIIGVDGSFVGTQPYYPGPPYQHPVSSPAYYPLAVQPRPDGIPNSFQDPHSLNADASNGTGPHAAGSSQIAGGIRAELTDNGLSQSHPSGKSSEELRSNAASIKQPAGLTSVTSGSIPHSAPSQISQDKSVSGSTQAATQFLLGGVSSSRSSTIKVSPVGNGLPNFGSNGRGWAVDKLRPRLHYGGVSKNGNGNGNLDSLSEQNRGPRTNRSKSQWASSISVEAYNANVKATTAQGNIIIHTDQYNKEDFPLNYADAKFFVIKSYSEDDVHKSIKYNVWSSTPNGNKRLDNAYEDAQRIAAEKPRGCPIFLFFSVNASGQFCGVAEMVGHVDFNKDMDFWQQDKWSGSFPVKWHMIKDVPNTNFRHIILENNENKPVTNSRDTQEIKRKQGLEMLNIFKNHALKTSILDDFIYYEERQRMIHEEKNRNLGKTYDSSLFVPAFVPGLVYQSPKLNDISNQNVPHEMAAAISSNEQFSAKSENDEGGDANHATSVLKIGSLTIHPRQAEAKSSVAVAEAKSSVAVAKAKTSVAVAEAKTSVAVAEAKTSVAVAEAKTSVAVVEAKSSVAAPRTEAIDVVTVGSMPIKVNGFTEASTSDVLTIGTIPIVPKAKFDKLNSSSSASGGVRDL